MNRWMPLEIEPFVARLAPYARHSLERAAELAARLHAEEISPEHWLAALLVDEDCAATRAVLHAFADPETLGIEVLALCAGIMVVGSVRTLPFSVLGVEALHGARALGVARGGARVDPADVFLSAYGRLRVELHQRLARFPEFALERVRNRSEREVEDPIRPEGPLFRCFSPDALRSLGASSRVASSLGRSSIGPMHLILGALETDADLRERSALSPQRVRMAASGLDEDSTPLPERRLGSEARLRELLSALATGAGTLDVLGWLLTHGSEEMTALLRRQKITPALFERCRGVYMDPEDGPDSP